MRHKIKLCAVFLNLLLIILIPLTGVTANAETFDLHIPSFGLYCENDNAEINGKVKYVVDENGKAVQYSEYTVNGTDGLNVYIPFVSNAYSLPETEITVNGKAAAIEIYYGERYYFNNGYTFYSSGIDETMTGTLYKITAQSDSFTVNFQTLENQIFIYRFTNKGKTIFNNDGYTYIADNALSETEYEIFVVNGDFKEYTSTDAESVKETLTVKEYIDRNFTANIEYFSDYDDVAPDLLYALINNATVNYNYYDFFFDSFSQQRLNAYKINLQADTDTNTINYSMPVEVQKNTAYNPVIYLAEQTATGNYNLDYTIELNKDLAYIIESSANIERQDDYIYVAQNVTDDFYFVFSSSAKPVKIIVNNSNKPLNTVVFIIGGISVCVAIVLSIYAITSYKKEKKYLKR